MAGVPARGSDVAGVGVHRLWSVPNRIAVAFSTDEFPPGEFIGGNGRDELAHGCQARD